MPSAGLIAAYFTSRRVIARRDHRTKMTSHTASKGSACI
jgi:hypothetical protein